MVSQHGRLFEIKTFLEILGHRVANLGPSEWGCRIHTAKTQGPTKVTASVSCAHSRLVRWRITVDILEPIDFSASEQRTGSQKSGKFGSMNHNSRVWD